MNAYIRKPLWYTAIGLSAAQFACFHSRRQRSDTGLDLAKHKNALQSCENNSDQYIRNTMIITSIHKVLVKLFQELHRLFKKTLHLKAENTILQYFCFKGVLWNQ